MAAIITDFRILSQPKYEILYIKGSILRDINCIEVKVTKDLFSILSL